MKDNNERQSMNERKKEHSIGLDLISSHLISCFHRFRFKFLYWIEFANQIMRMNYDEIQYNTIQ